MFSGEGGQSAPFFPPSSVSQGGAHFHLSVRQFVSSSVSSVSFSFVSSSVSSVHQLHQFHFHSSVRQFHQFISFISSSVSFSFVSSSVRQFHFHSSVRQFVSLSVRQFHQFHFHLSVRQFVSFIFIFICQFVSSSENVKSPDADWLFPLMKHKGRHSHQHQGTVKKSLPHSAWRAGINYIFNTQKSDNSSSARSRERVLQR